jgi:hypothetical protein
MSFILYFYKGYRIDKHIAKIIYFDYQAFSYETISPEEYFKDRSEAVVNDNKNLELDDDEQQEKGNENKLQLRENKIVTTERENLQVDSHDIEITRTVTNVSTRGKTNEVKNIITMLDYDCLLPNDSLKYDNRKNISYLKDILIIEHPLLSLIYKHSLLDPMFMRLLQLEFSLCMQVGINALLYSDAYIDQLHEAENSVS